MLPLLPPSLPLSVSGLPPPSLIEPDWSASDFGMGCAQTTGSRGSALTITLLGHPEVDLSDFKEKAACTRNSQQKVENWICSCRSPLSLLKLDPSRLEGEAAMYLQFSTKLL